MEDKPIPLLKHLEVLRRVLLVSLVAVAACSLVAYFYYDYLLAIFLRPVTQWHYQLVFIGVTEAFLTRLRLSFFSGVLLALPVIFWQAWKFLLPALKRNERRLLLLLVPLSVLFFLLGVCFGFFAVLPAGVKVLLAMGGPSIAPMISLGNYISFVIKFLLPFGLIFETPVVVLFLARAGLITHSYLARRRKYAVLIIAVASAALTPSPDVFTQLMLGLPTYLVFELSVLIARFVRPAPVDLAARREGSGFASGIWSQT
ncbi:twin-arginine translocase subunit TatC [Desulfotomaculum copahuensis]|uniref:Sec-independent protein translocase protein TatC n=1 Tax=Desulfotomaculum copahuensis TaxID=1838280 RepID=A0A1B7LGB0_9FIRM|nr:twin-arginine translocase subunit TatC [Desulfotomaculum copahuensis]OAT84833.1 twin arginine-targeting protein translocase TatC [Desulfotomaculum copahuensis]